MKSISFDFLAGEGPVHGLEYRFLEEYQYEAQTSISAFQCVSTSAFLLLADG